MTRTERRERPSLDFALITDPEGLYALQPEWDAVHAADDGAYLGQAFAWTRIAWETTVRPRGGMVACLTGRRDGRLVLVWPLARHRQSAWSMLRPLNSQSSEYSTVLVAPGEDAEGHVAAAWRYLHAHADSDLVSLPDVRDDSPLGAAMADGGLCWTPYTQAAPWLRTTDFASWEDLHACVSGRQRAELRRRLRRLGDRGEVRFEAVHDPRRRRRIVDWMLDRKAAWMARAGHTNAWLLTDEHRAFLAASTDAFPESRLLLALTCGERLVAAELMSVDRRRVEGFLGAFDPDFGKFSPGRLIKTECVRWAFERGLDFDMRLGEESWKDAWANRRAQVTSYVYAASAWGAVYLAAQAARQRAMDHLPEPARAATDALAARFTALVASR